MDVLFDVDVDIDGVKCAEFHGVFSRYGGGRCGAVASVSGALGGQGGDGVQRCRLGQGVAADDFGQGGSPQDLLRRDFEFLAGTVPWDQRHGGDAVGHMTRGEGVSQRCRDTTR